MLGSCKTSSNGRCNDLMFLVVILIYSANDSAPLMGTFPKFYILINFIFDFPSDTIHCTLAMATFIIAPLDNKLLFHQCDQIENESEPKLCSTAFTPYVEGDLFSKQSHISSNNMIYYLSDTCMCNYSRIITGFQNH